MLISFERLSVPPSAWPRLRDSFLPFPDPALPLSGLLSAPVCTLSGFLSSWAPAGRRRRGLRLLCPSSLE
jgi:hypothetical protein